MMNGTKVSPWYYFCIVVIQVRYYCRLKKNIILLKWIYLSFAAFLLFLPILNPLVFTGQGVFDSKFTFSSRGATCHLITPNPSQYCQGIHPVPAVTAISRKCWIGASPLSIQMPLLRISTALR